MSKGNFKKLSYLLNLQILRDLKITIGSAAGIMLLNIAYFSYSLSDELKIYLEKTENIKDPPDSTVLLSEVPA